MEQTTTVPSLPENLWQRDESLRQAADLIARWDGKLKAVSFDFFDTIVWRMVRKPVDVFHEVGRQLHQQGALKPGVLAEDFETLRRHAEYKARERQNLIDPRQEDISLADIYRNLHSVLKNPDAAAQLEHALECKLCLLNPGMADFIRHVRNRGLKVVVISDIYFSVEQLRDILRANQFDPNTFEFILSSSAEKVCKGTGRLFKVALKKLGIQAGEMLHLGDNFHADVSGARLAGIRACHYPQASPDLNTILEREQVLLGSKVTTFNSSSLRMLTARYFPQDTEEGFFGRAGAFLLGPLMSRFASWACEQYLAAGVRKVGAFMREGDLFAKTLQREADARGYDLEIQPLFINRKATDLAALGKLTAPAVIDWLERRCTLPIGEILKHFGLPVEDLKKLPLSLNEKADSKEKILKLAEFLFTPAIARRIEATSAEERRMVMDYLQPWISSGGALGVCDIGYSASAQSQLHRILELEGSPVKVVGCYMVTYEKAADRVLQGMDIRHFLGAFGKPDFNFRTFIRSPAFIEQSLVAPMGTTLGYERNADGSIKPILDRMPFGPKMLARQKAFKEGVLLFQTLWLHCRASKGGLLDAASEFSHRVLADIDASSQATLARATAFPLASEVKHFGSLPLDDYYFADSMKTLCSEKDRALLRKKGYGHILGHAGVHWPQGVHAVENPRANSEFFSYAKALIYCNPERDGDSSPVDLTIYVQAVRSAAALRECIRRINARTNANLQIELVIGFPANNTGLADAANEFANHFPRFRMGEIPTRDAASLPYNSAVDESLAPYVLFLNEEALLPQGWDEALLSPLLKDAKIAAALPKFEWSKGLSSEPSTRCLMVRREAFIEGLGMKNEMTPDGGVWKLLLHLKALQWKIHLYAEAVVKIDAPLKAKAINSADALFLKDCWPDFATQIAALSGGNEKNSALEISQPQKSTAAQNLKIDWAGSFLDYGSLSQVNRECVVALKTTSVFTISAVNGANSTTAVPAQFQVLAKTLAKAPSADAAVTIRHQWPPDWSRPKNGALVVIQPWEFGALPDDWVSAAVNVDEFWVPSNYVRQVYVASGVPSAKVAVVPNGVDVNHFKAGVEPLKLATKKKFRFLFVGGTIQRKGPDVLLKAYLEAFTAADDVCLVIKDFGGKTVYEGQTFEKEIATARLKPDAPEMLYLNDELEPSDMPKLYATCHCLVHPYRGEGFGLPVLEAMACALPVVVTRGGATDDFVSEANGWSINSQKVSLGKKIGTIALAADGWWLEPDAADLAAKLKFVFANPSEAQKRGVQGAETARSRHTWSHVASQINTRLEKLTGTAKAAVAKPVTKIELPPVALIGHLAKAREAFNQKKFIPAWDAAVIAAQERPFHPEAFLLLSEIASAVGDVEKAKLCLDRARQFAPKWKAVSQAGKNIRKNPAKLPIGLAPFELPKSSRLSVCLIVKNEEQFLERCLNSIRDVAWQIVVVDTGSTDRTIEIAKKFNAEIHSFTWINDFAAARNEALKHAKGDWILSLDADEELLAEHRETLRSEMEAVKFIGYRLPIIDAGREQEGSSFVPRLFRNAPGLFFLGRVHEQAFSSLEVRAREWELEHGFGKTTLLHHGYVKEVVVSRDKVNRNLRLLELAISEMPGEPNLTMNLGLELIRSGQMDAGLEKYQAAVDLMSAQPAKDVAPELRETLLTQFASHLLTAKRYTEIVQLFDGKLAGSAPLTASQHFTLGLAHLELKQPAQVIEQMRRCIAKRDKATLSPRNKEIFKAGPNHCLALALLASNDVAGAGAAFELAIKDDPQSRTVAFDFAKFLFQQSRPVEALQILNRLVEEKPDDAMAWSFGGQIALSQPEFAEFSLNWTSEALKLLPKNPVLNLQRAETLLLNQQENDALPLFTEFHSPNSARHLAAIVLCEVNTGSSERTFNPAEEKVVSQEFLKWYRQLIRHNGALLVQRINGNLDRLESILPGAASALSKALKQATESIAA